MAFYQYKNEGGKEPSHISEEVKEGRQGICIKLNTIIIDIAADKRWRFLSSYPSRIADLQAGVFGGFCLCAVLRLIWLAP